MTTAFSLKSNQYTIYTKSYVDTSVGLTANQVATYTKEEVYQALVPNSTAAYVNAQLALNAHLSDMTAALGLEANHATTYTKVRQ